MAAKRRVCIVSILMIIWHSANPSTGYSLSWLIGIGNGDRVSSALGHRDRLKCKESGHLDASWSSAGNTQAAAAASSTHNIEHAPGMTFSAEYDADSLSILYERGLKSAQASRLEPFPEFPAENLATSNCWLAAYSSLTASCKDILQNETWKAGLAFELTLCFLQASGRPLSCTPKGKAVTTRGINKKENPSSWNLRYAEMVEKCISSMTDHEHSVFLAFFIDAPNLCHYLQ